MPKYSFKCLTCSHEFDKIQKITEDNPLCEKCGSSRTNKQVTAPLAVHGGGYGWYGKGGSKSHR